MLTMRHQLCPAAIGPRVIYETSSDQHTVSYLPDILKKQRKRLIHIGQLTTNFTSFLEVINGVSCVYH
jgi:hypothetical protein